MPGRRWILAGLVLLPLRLAHAQAAPPATEDQGPAAAFVQRAGAELAAVVSGATSPADKQARMAPYLERVVDEDGVARFCLGRYWLTATPEQRTEYLRLFRLVLLRGVVSRLGDYQAGSVKVTVNTPVEKPDGIYVPTVVERSGNKPVSITWLVTTEGHGMQIADVVAEGMSLRVTQRSDYASFLARNHGDVGVLIAAMKRQVGEE
jgi:phospholipid transport system substrate-binding protein